MYGRWNVAICSKIFCMHAIMLFYAIIELCLCGVHMHVQFFNMYMQFCNICVQCLLLQSV
jgi:hypothetical protein